MYSLKVNFLLLRVVVARAIGAHGFRYGNDCSALESGKQRSPMVMGFEYANLLALSQLLAGTFVACS